jgi:signal transduction histidine kinase
MAAMKTRLFLIAAIFFCSFQSQTLFAAEEQDLPKEIFTLASVVFETERSDDGQWIFVNAASAADGKNRLYSFDQKTGEARVLFEPYPDTQTRFVYGMHFWKKTQKLYFIVHNGEYTVNGTGNLFLHEGLYTAQKDADQNYSALGAWRQSALESWLAKNLWSAYIQKPEQPDYDGFLSALYTFADPGTNPIFVLPKENGGAEKDAALYGKKALEWIIQNKKQNEFLGQIADTSVFPLEKYLFCRDKDGKLLQKSAVTVMQRTPANYKNAGMIWTETTFAEANQSLYCVLMKGSFKKQNDWNGQWTWDYSLVFEIKDDESGIKFFEPEALKDIRAVTYSLNASDPLPIEGREDGLLIRDTDGKTKWLYDGTKVEPLSKSPFQFALTKDGDSAAAWLVRICAGLVFVILLLLLLFYEFLKGRFSVSWQKRIAFQIQEEERGKISRDIHDSIVQDIRAIRIEAEMLKVQEGQEQKQKDLSEKITDCIIKMRNICYGLEPAEFSLPSPNPGKINLLSILKSLGEQFEAKSKIKCSLNAAQGLEEILVEKEKCQCLVRIVQEALANIEKHSYATEAQILARTESQQNKKILALFIIDNGRGCDLDKARSGANWRTHFGLRQMQERAKTIGAAISFRSAPDDGMQIKLSVEI